jgi:hypothetical protein
MSITLYLRSFFLVIPLVCVLISYGQSNPSVASAKRGNVEKGEGGSEVVQQVLVPISAAEPLLNAFNLNKFPMLSMSSFNSHMLVVQGLPAEKLEGLLSEHLSANPMSFDDYLSYVLPGPVLSGDEKMDIEKYDLALKQFQLSHPEVLWYQPKEVDAMLQSEGGIHKLMKLQEKRNRAVSLQTLLYKPSSVSPLMDPVKMATD